MIRTIDRPSVRLLIAVPLAAAALAGCSSSSGGGTASVQASAPTAGSGGQGAPGGSGGASAGAGVQGGGRFPGVSGQTAALQGDTLQVRTAEGQTAVQFTSSTRITEQKAATKAAIAVGACLVATGQPAGGGVAATSVTISPAPGTGTCAAENGFGGGAGGGFGGFGGSRPGRPSGSPMSPQGGQPTPGGPGGQRANFANAYGTVTAVSGDTVTLSGNLLQGGARGGASARPTASPTASPTPTTVTVTLASATTYAQTQVVASSALAVGQCVTALGQPNDIGVVAARSIAIRAAGANGCTNGFGRRGASASPSASGNA